MPRFSFHRPNLHLPKFTFLKERFREALVFSRKKPITSLLLALLVLLALILAGNFLFASKTSQIQANPPIKQVQIYTIGSVPKVITQAQVQNSGVITITALTSGVVQAINVTEGSQVAKGANLITLSSDYSGANAPVIQQSIAAKQLQQINDTFDTQKQLIQKQRDLANATNQNSTNLRDISAKSISDLQTVLDQNQDTLNTARSNLNDLEALPTSPDTKAQILQLKGLLGQLDSAQAQTRQQLLNTQYQTNTSNPPTQLNDIQKDITLKQLDIQEKNLQTTKEIAGLQVALAAVSASLLHPTAPFGATVEKIQVREGQAVNPGTALLILSNNQQNLTAIAKVPQSLADQVSQVEDSVLHLRNTPVFVKRTFISTVATDGLLYSVFYTIPDGYNLTDNEYIKVEIPVGVPDTSSSVPFVPLDSIFQTQDHSYLYLNQSGKVVSRQVTTGEVIGSYVQILSGLNKGDQVILNRNVIEGDQVEATH